jgi:hypothetical protein
MQCPVGAPQRHVSPAPRSPAQNPSGAVSGRSEPWRRTLNSLAQSAKVNPPQSLLSERRPDAAETTKTRAERCQAGASLGGEHPTPSRKARKLILLRAYSASVGLMPRSSFKNTVVVWSGTFCVDMRDRPPADSSGAVSGRSEPWRRTLNSLAQSAKVPPPQSLLSERRPDAA